ncbi:uncharacterized protein B0I36DRAFT_318048 [Microdochium trichocladiopsis]|uniref:Uncharacterized protein n=1 Tax=Microdochium trichocladiopsis TaxID=1682393 RepID=A0A9P8YE50_9PEZI|nr:uncharacterized protein B0I36DRAFT_318048 [Microdochium trichocladiopsis]KAH7035291.1 hypothetical protein B0I36DRAFT_318048 [Microdochium trichocladiopsis]
MATLSSRMAAFQSLDESVHRPGPADGFARHSVLAPRREMLRNFSYPTRAVKPASRLSTAQTPRTPWQSLDEKSPSRGTNDKKEPASLKPEYLAYLSLLEPESSPEDDEEPRNSVICEKCSKKLDPVDEKSLDDQDGEAEIHAMTTVETTIEASPQPHRPKPVDVEACRNQEATLDVGSPSSPERSPVSPAFLQRGFSRRRKSTTQSQYSSDRSSVDGGSVHTMQTAKLSKRSSREAKSGWLSQIKEWTSVAEPSSQAIKQHKVETFGKAGIAPNDPRARAKLNLPTATLPPEAIKPAGRPLKPDEIMRRQAGERKKQEREERWSMSSSAGRLSHASRSSMSGHSSSSSLGRTCHSKAES